MLTLRLLTFLSFTIIWFTKVSSQDKPNYLPEIPLEELYNRGIVPYNSSYKSNYYRIMPYLYYNSGNNFREIKGDFISLKHPIHEEVNLMVGFFSRYGNYRNVLQALIWVKSTNKEGLKNIEIEVQSSKHGQLQFTPRKQNPNRPKFSEDFLYTRQIKLNRPSDILEKIKDDVITITIDGQKYELLNPEIQLN